MQVADDDDDNATEDPKPHRPKLTSSNSPNSRCVSVPQVTGGDDDNSPSTTEDQRPRPKLTASNSGADIMLGLETDEGQSAEVEGGVGQHGGGRSGGGVGQQGERE